jgi:hypothetical protein
MRLKVVGRIKKQKKRQKEKKGNRPCKEKLDGREIIGNSGISDKDILANVKSICYEVLCCEI